MNFIKTPRAKSTTTVASTHIHINIEVKYANIGWCLSFELKYTVMKYNSKFIKIPKCKMTITSVISVSYVRHNILPFFMFFT